MSRRNAFDWRCLTSVALGATSVFAFAPFDWFAVGWLTLGGLFALLSTEADTTARPRTGATLAAAYAFGLFLAGVSWVYISLRVFGGMPAVLAGMATLLLCAFLSVSTAAAGALFVRWAPPGWLARSLLFSSLWLLAEWTRGWACTGFPWLATGYAQTPPSPLAGFAPIVGVYGVSLLTAAVGALLVAGISRSLTTGHVARRSWLPPVSARPLLVCALILIVGAVLREIRWTQPSGEPFTVALLQGNVPQEMKWRPERFVDSLLTYGRLVGEHPARLTILPETALPSFLEHVPANYVDELERLALRDQGDLLLGIAVNDGGRYFNSAISLGASGHQRYDKVHLVPFGEFVPPGFSWFMALVNIPLSDFTSGSTARAPLRLAGERVAVNICYEDLFGEEIIRALPAATLLVNLSNVAWFGDSLAPAQHLQIAQMRALESGRMMLRATNTGMTAIVGADGRVQAALTPFTRGALVDKVRGHSGATPYVLWGNGPAIICALLLCFTVRNRTGRKEKRSPGGSVTPRPGPREDSREHCRPHLRFASSRNIRLIALSTAAAQATLIISSGSLTASGQTRNLRGSHARAGSSTGTRRS